MPNAIHLSHGKEQPFGLLANNAETPMLIDNVRYTSVTEYVYKSLFVSQEAKDRMRINQPYPRAMQIKMEDDQSLYISSIVAGMYAKYEQYIEFRNYLKSFGKKRLIFSWGNEEENRQFHILINNLRDIDGKFFIDEKYGFVPIEEVNKVIHGVFKDLKRNPFLPTEPFSVLRQTYSQVENPPTIKRSVTQFLEKLDEIIPFLKIKFKNTLFSDELEKFKKHLLDVTLDYVIETYYSYLPRSQNRTAKQQQMSKIGRANVMKYEDDLYDQYVEGNLSDEITDRLTFEPNIPRSANVTAENIEQQMAETEEEEDQPPAEEGEVVIPSGSMLYPDYPERIRINDEEYLSVVAYAYAVLFKNSGRALNLAAMRAPLREVVDGYIEYRKQAMSDRILAAHKRAIGVKFSDKSLQDLLLRTGNADLIWNDPTDPILGMDDNVTGKYLVVIRNSIKPFPSPSITTPHDNIVTHSFFQYVAEDFSNTLKMLSVHSVKNLETVYGMDVKTINVPVEATRETASIMTDAGITRSDHKIVVKFIALTLNDVRKKGIDAIVKTFDLSQPTRDDLKAAKDNLNNIYRLLAASNAVWSWVTAGEFIDRMLSNENYTDTVRDNYVPWRIHRWASVDVWQ